MYAVVSSGGKQYRVEPGTTLSMERTGNGAGEAITFDRVLLIGDGDEVKVGTPHLDGASVSATVLGEELGPKLVIFKFKQKVKYRRRTGHRQHLVRVRIDAINADGGTRKRKTAAKAREEAEAAVEAQPKAAPKPRARRQSKPKAADASDAEPKPRAKRAAKPKAKADAPKEQ